MLHPDMYLQTDHDLPRSAIGYACERVKGSMNPTHSHWRGQLIYAISGSLKVVSTAGTWIVPPERAVWMPPKVQHSVQSVTEAETRFLYLDTVVYTTLPKTVTVIHMTPLMRECLLKFLSLPRFYDENGVAKHLLALMIEELQIMPVMPLHLPLPKNASLLDAANAILAQMADRPKLTILAAQAGLSVRSFERHFHNETGLTWRKWVHQARLMEAISQLSDGRMVGDVAHALGYEGPSAFVAMFKKATGLTPGKYFSNIDVA